LPAPTGVVVVGVGVVVVGVGVVVVGVVFEGLPPPPPPPLSQATKENPITAMRAIVPRNLSSFFIENSFQKYINRQAAYFQNDRKTCVLSKINPRKDKKEVFNTHFLIYGALRLDLSIIIVFYQSPKEVVNKD
jgi:hypothetical protein